MSLSFAQKNIVIVGIFKPSILDKHFFIKNELFKEEEILPSSQFSTMVNQVITDNYNIVILANQIIVSSVKPIISDDSIVGLSKLIVEKGKISNITSVGLNFHWNDRHSDLASLSMTSKKFFYSDQITMFKQFFNSEDCAFGTYASKNFKGARLKVDVKPASVQEIATSEIFEALVYTFNFHFDIAKKEDSSETLEIFNRYNEYQEEAAKIMTLY